jgi:hypothetical protein
MQKTICDYAGCGPPPADSTMHVYMTTEPPLSGVEFDACSFGHAQAHYESLTSAATSESATDDAPATMPAKRRKT